MNPLHSREDPRPALIRTISETVPEPNTRVHSLARPATEAVVQAPGCGVYEYDSAKRQITAARIYFDVGTILKQIIDPRDPLGGYS